ncbi:MAG: hypothetical protein Q8S13_09160 [Dehalococcoidia bacterium]|nr:hypothetical protein [Dehalococcoidia bacterium]
MDADIRRILSRPEILFESEASERVRLIREAFGEPGDGSPGADVAWLLGLIDRIWKIKPPTP